MSDSPTTRRKPTLAVRPSLLSITRAHPSTSAPSTPAPTLSRRASGYVDAPTVAESTEAPVLADDAPRSGSVSPAPQPSTPDVKGKGRATTVESPPDSRDLLRQQLRKSEEHASKRRKPRSARPGLQRAPSTMMVDLDASIGTLATPTHRRYFILSTAGKLVYSSDPEDAEAATTYAGVMQALVSIFADDDDRLRYLNAGQLRIAFLLRSPLYLVTVSDWGEPESVLRSHLDYLHLHILSVITASQLQRIFKQSSNFDLRRLLEGNDVPMAALIKRLHTEFAVMTSALEVFRIPSTVRDSIAKALAPSPAQTKDLLYAIALAGGRVVTLLRPKRHSVHPSDLHLLLNTIAASPSLSAAGSETWLPICLPRYNSSGFLHAFVGSLAPSITLVFVSADREAFFGLRDWKAELVPKLPLAALERALDRQSYRCGELAVAGLRHFVYKARPLVQVTAPTWDAEYEAEADRQRIVTLYQRAIDLLHPRSNTGRQPAKLVLLRSEHEAVLGWATEAFELYAAVSPMLPTTAAVAAAHAIVRWVKERDSELFLGGAPTF